MVDAKLLDFVKKSLSLGRQKGIIMDELTKAGWSEKEVKNAFFIAETSPQEETKEEKPHLSMTEVLNRGLFLNLKSRIAVNLVPLVGYAMFAFAGIALPYVLASYEGNMKTFGIAFSQIFFQFLAFYFIVRMYGNAMRENGFPIEENGIFTFIKCLLSFLYSYFLSFFVWYFEKFRWVAFADLLINSFIIIATMSFSSNIGSLNQTAPFCCFFSVIVYTIWIAHFVGFFWHAIRLLFSVPLSLLNEVSSFEAPRISWKLSEEMDIHLLMALFILLPLSAINTAPLLLTQITAFNEQILLICAFAGMLAVGLANLIYVNFLVALMRGFMDFKGVGVREISMKLAEGEEGFKVKPRY